MLIINSRTRNLFTWILILLISFIILSTIAYMNVIYKIEEVYIASKFIPEGTKIDRSNFTEYIGILKVPSEFLEKMKLLKATQENQLLIMKSYIKYNRDIGDFITSNVLKTSIKDPMKYLISEISNKAADNKFLIPILVDIPHADRVFTQGVQIKDRIQIWFINSENQGNKKVTKLTVRYKDVPIIKLNKVGEYVSSIVIALPADLAKKYELEKRHAQEVKIIFNPLNYKKGENLFLSFESGGSAILFNEWNNINIDGTFFYYLKEQKNDKEIVSLTARDVQKLIDNVFLTMDFKYTANFNKLKNDFKVYTFSLGLNAKKFIINNLVLSSDISKELYSYLEELKDKNKIITKGNINISYSF